MHALVCGSYLESGAWYPVGGGEMFAEHLIPTITKAGGEARGGMKVETLLGIDDEVVGVRRAKGEDIRADVVIPNIGARETIQNLLPKGFGLKDWIREFEALPPSIAHFSHFMGFEADIEETGAIRSNHWFYPTREVDVMWTDAPDGDPPGFFVSFASLKDPSHDPGPRRNPPAIWWSGPIGTLSRIGRTFPRARGSPVLTAVRTGEIRGARLGRDPVAIRHLVHPR